MSIRSFFIGVLIVIGALFLGLLGIGCTAWNARVQIVSQEQAYQARWADVQSQYQRRTDLLPNLASTVKAYAGEESSVWKDFAAARSQAEAASKAPDLATNPDKQAAFLKAQENLTLKVNVVREAYPELKSDKLFVKMMDEIAGTENRVNVCRERYNSSIEDYNRTVGTWGSLFGYHRVEFYRADDQAQKAPTLKF